MKNKTKKLLTGLGLGLLGAITLTGCTSDIVFNQSDLDKAITGINTYLDTQNNYSSEFARNTLNDLLIKASFKATQVTSYSQTGIETFKDDIGNIINSSTGIEKIYHDKNSNTTKIYRTDNNNSVDIYSETQYNSNSRSYTTKVYDLKDKEWYETTSSTYQNDPHLLSYTLDERINEYLIIVSETDKLVGDITMEKINDNTYDFYFARHYSIDASEGGWGEGFAGQMMEYIENYQLRFTNGEFTSVKLTVRCDFQFPGIFFGELNLDWNCNDFTVDTSKCTTKIDPPTYD